MKVCKSETLCLACMVNRSLLYNAVLCIVNLCPIVLNPEIVMYIKIVWFAPLQLSSAPSTYSSIVMSYNDEHYRIDGLKPIHILYCENRI